MADERSKGRHERPKTSPPPPPQPKLELRHHLTKVEAGSFKIALEVIVTQGSSALNGKHVQFYIGPFANGPAVVTDENGRAIKEIKGDSQDKETEIVVEAQIVGSATSTKISVPVQADPNKKAPVAPTAPTGPKRIDSLAVNAAGDKNGQWVISVFATAQDGSPVDGTKIAFLYNGEIEEKVLEKGIASHKIVITEKSGEVIVQAPGIEPKPLRLAGPKEKIVPPPKPESTKSKGILGRFWDGFTTPKQRRS